MVLMLCGLSDVADVHPLDLHGQRRMVAVASSSILSLKYYCLMSLLAILMHIGWLVLRIGQGYKNIRDICSCY